MDEKSRSNRCSGRSSKKVRTEKWPRSWFAYTQDGRLASTEKQIEEERKFDGGSTLKTTSFETDLNGGQHETEHRTVETRVQGTTTTVATVVDRASLNGAGQVVEKKDTVIEATASGARVNESVYRPNPEGRLVETLRQVSTETKSGNLTTSQTAYYEPDMQGKLALARQNVSKTIKNPDGSEVTQVDLYARSIDGLVQSADAPQQVKEEQIIERRQGPGGAIVETLSVRRPTLADPKKLGNLETVSETVCRGTCGPAKQDAP
jgi:hypothetical protein